jgi:hypothetical protein
VENLCAGSHALAVDRQICVERVKGCLEIEESLLGCFLSA